MISNFLNKESDAFEKKGWNIGVYIVFIMKMLFSIITFAYLFSNVQDEFKKISKFARKSKNEK